MRYSYSTKCDGSKGFVSDPVEAGSDRWQRVHAYLDECGGVLQRRRADLAADLGIPDRALGRVLERMEKLRVIRVERRSGAIGEGRLPNTYRLLISPQEWEERGEAIKKEHRAKARRSKKRRSTTAKPEPRPAPPPPPPEFVQREVKRAVTGSDELDVEAWLGGEAVD